MVRRTQYVENCVGCTARNKDIHVTIAALAMAYLVDAQSVCIYAQQDIVHHFHHWKVSLYGSSSHYILLSSRLLSPEGMQTSVSRRNAYFSFSTVAHFAYRCLESCASRHSSLSEEPGHQEEDKILFWTPCNRKGIKQDGKENPKQKRYAGCTTSSNRYKEIIQNSTMA